MNEEPDAKIEMGIVGVLIIVLVSLLVGVLYWTNRAKSEEINAVSPASAGYCSLYAREAVRIDLMHTIPVKPDEVSDKYIVDLAVQVFKACTSVLPTLLPLPEDHRQLSTWVNDMRYLITQRDVAIAVAGTEPATVGEDDWAAQCAAEYRSWNPEDGTVVRRGSPTPVRCPCGREVVCGN